MILQKYYLQKQGTINSLLNDHPTLAAKNIGFRLCNDYIFTPQGNQETTFPLLMFKYDKVEWTTSSEKEYKADVNFEVHIVFDTTSETSFEADVFEIAALVDKAILEYPTSAQLSVPDHELISNSAFKVCEEQAQLEDSYWEKSQHFIWCIKYKTTLVDQELKKKYTLANNNFRVYYNTDVAHQDYVMELGEIERREQTILTADNIVEGDEREIKKQD